MPLSGPPARGHLRLAAPLEQRPRSTSRTLLLLRALAASIVLLVATALAWISSALALAPLLWRRAPLGGRLRPLRAREARVIKFQPRQQALPR